MAASKNSKPKKKRHLTAKQKSNAKKSAAKHGRSQPGLWENVNASKNKGPGNKKKSKKSASKGKTRPGKRSKGKKKSSKK